MFLRIFQWMYDKAFIWAEHRHALCCLFDLSFTESVIFPIASFIGRASRHFFVAGLMY
jgi:membrane protein YqaA with SNARE-associated domain